MHITYFYIYRAFVIRRNSLAKESTAATRVMQSSSNELSSPVSESAKCKQKKANTKCVYFPS